MNFSTIDLNNFSCPNCKNRIDKKLNSEKIVYEYELDEKIIKNTYLFSCPRCMQPIVYSDDHNIFWRKTKEYDYKNWLVFSNFYNCQNLLYLYNPLFKNKSVINSLISLLDRNKKYIIFVPEFMFEYYEENNMDEICHSLYIIPSSFYNDVIGTIYPSLLVELNLLQINVNNKISFYYTIFKTNFNNVYTCNDFEILKQEVKL